MISDPEDDFRAATRCLKGSTQQLLCMENAVRCNQETSLDRTLHASKTIHGLGLVQNSNTKELGRRSRSARPISALVDAIRRRWAAGFALVGSERRSEGWSSRISNAEKAFYGGFCEPSAIQRVLGWRFAKVGKSTGLARASGRR
jgi:hypothetical protein